MATATPDDRLPVSAVSRAGTPVMARASRVGDPSSAAVSHRLPVSLRWNRLKGRTQLRQAGHGAAYHAASACTRKGYSNSCATAVCTGVTPDVRVMGGDAPPGKTSRRRTPRTVLGSPSPTSVTAKCRTDPSRAPAFCLDTATRNTPPAGEYFVAQTCSARRNHCASPMVGRDSRRSLASYSNNSA